MEQTESMPGCKKLHKPIYTWCILGAFILSWLLVLGGAYVLWGFGGIFGWSKVFVVAKTLVYLFAAIALTLFFIYIFGCTSSAAKRDLDALVSLSKRRH